LEAVEKEREIGATVQCNLKPAAQCLEAAAKSRTVLGQIMWTFHYRDKVTFLQLYKKYVRPHLEFSTPAWSPWSQTDKISTGNGPIEKVQMNVVNMISGLRS
jgi:hypothetical protein